MTVYLVRHAIAKSRSSWDGSDRQRPLTKKGEHQARGLAALLDDADVRLVLSSPALRCLDTVTPLAEKHNMDVGQTTVLAEGSATKGVVNLVHEAAASKGDTVLCTHGDLVPEVLRALRKEGVDLLDRLLFPKGSTWVLSGDGKHLTQGRYLAPPGDR